MARDVAELNALIRTCELSAEQHITYARRAHTDYQRLFHERRAADDLLRAAKLRDELRGLLESQGDPGETG